MRIIIVSNRLPVNVRKSENGKFEYLQSVGGVATGLLAYLQSYVSEDYEYLWIGWPGMQISKKDRLQVRDYLNKEFHAYPIFVKEKLMDSFYLGFCNKTIWPLFHYFPTLCHFDDAYWKSYEEVNMIFCEELKKILRKDDIIWIHDYHFMLLPGMLRKYFPRQNIGFFLHIPFPSFEIFRLLPQLWRFKILEGLLGCDLIGFHTHDYCQHFLRSILRIFGKENIMGKILLEDRIVKVDTFPMGIDYNKFNNSSNLKEVQEEIEKNKISFNRKKIILSIDRLDYTKGIINRLQGYEKFLEKNLSYHEKVALVAIVVPSRIGVDKYQDMKKNLEELISRINGKFAKMDWSPIIYQYKSLGFESLCAIYSCSHIALVTPLRDGMNLIAKEYIASRSDKTGVLILSEMVGAAKELGEAIIINPNDIERIGTAIKEALEMPIEEQKLKNDIMQQRLKRYDIKRWSEDFIKKLKNTTKEQEKVFINYLGHDSMERLLKEYSRAKSRLIFLDYDGTLVPFYSRPEYAVPSKEVMENLSKLCDDKKNIVIIISGRDKENLEKWFGELNLQIIAEHGAWRFNLEKKWVMNKALKNDWKVNIRQIFELYTDRLPGSFIEEKDYSIAWHYRLADYDQSSDRVKEIIDDLVIYTANHDLQVIRGNKVIEVRNTGINKGDSALEFLNQVESEFILALGDDFTDEDLFIALPKSAFSIKIGINKSNARFHLKNVYEANKLISKLTERKLIQYKNDK